MAREQSCDVCPTVAKDSFPMGWGGFHGTDSLGQHFSKDLCPRCSAMLQVMMGELRRRFAVPPPAAISKPIVDAPLSAEKTKAIVPRPLSTADVHADGSVCDGALCMHPQHFGRGPL